MGATPALAQLESDAQRAYFDWLKLVPAPGRPGRTLRDFAYAIPNGQMLAGSAEQRARYMNFLKGQGLTPGVSDVCIALPVGRYHGAYIEMKRGAAEIKAATKEQVDWVALMASVGYYAAIAGGFDSAKEHTEAFIRG